jgi:glutathione S-transferase
MVILHRCMTPTNWLCPCGKTARALKRSGLDYQQVRVPYRKRDRAEVIEITGQDRVPVLELDGQAICDSKRIVEHLAWRATRPSAPASTPGTSGSA